MLTEKPWKADIALYLIAGLLLCIGLGSIVAQALLNLEAVEAFGDKQLMTVVVGTFIMQLPMLVMIGAYVILNGYSWKEAFGFSLTRWRRNLLLAVMATVVALTLSIVITKFVWWFLETVGTSPQEQTTVEALRSARSLGQQIAFGVVAVVIAPIVEELLFRGILYPAIKQRGHRSLALWGTAIMFGIVHSNLVTFIPLTIFALILTFLYEETDNLLAPIAAHSMFNATNFAYLVYQSAQ